MRFGALAPHVAFLDVFLRIVPCASRVGHENGQDEACTQSADQQSQHTGHSEEDTDEHRHDDRQQ